MSAIDVLVRSSLVLLAGFGALWLLSRQTAALRHWTLAFVILLGEQEKRHFEQLHFSAVRRAGDTLYLSGVVVYPTDANSDFAAATRSVFRNIEQQLRASGSDLAHVVALQTFHVWDSPFGGGTKNKQFETFAAVKDEFLRAPYPAWTAVGVTELLPDQGVVEIQVTAIVAESREKPD